MLTLRGRENLGAMAINGYSAFPKAPQLQEPHYQIVYCHMQDTRRCGGFTSFQRSSRYILQPQATEQKMTSSYEDGIFLILITKKMKKPKGSRFPNCGLVCTEIKCLFSSTFELILLHKFSKSIFIEAWWASWSGFIS